MNTICMRRLNLLTSNEIIVLLSNNLIRNYWICMCSLRNPSRHVEKWNYKSNDNERWNDSYNKGKEWKSSWDKNPNNSLGAIYMY